MTGLETIQDGENFQAGGGQRHGGGVPERRRRAHGRRRRTTGRGEAGVRADFAARVRACEVDENIDGVMPHRA